MKKLLLTLLIASAALIAQAQSAKAIYLFDGNTSDSAGSNHLTTNAVTFTADVEGKAGKAASFNGTSSYAQAPAAIFTSLPINMRLSLWFKTNANQKGGGLVSASLETVGNYVSNYTPVLYIDTFGKLNSLLYDGTVTPLKSSAAVNDDKWHHAMVVYTINPNTKALTQELFLDGVSVASKSGTLSGTPSFANIYFGACCARGIGDVPAGWMYFNGSIDDISIYNDVLGYGTWANLMYKLTSAPQSRTISKGDSVSMRISYTNFLNEPASNFICQWKKNGNAVGKDSAVHVISSSTYADSGSYTVEVSNIYGKKLVSQVAVLKVNFPVGISSNHAASMVQFFPNPVEDFLMINTKENYLVSIFDASGKQIAQGYTNQMISAAQWPQGYYIFKTQTNEGEVFSGKFIKQ